MTALQAALTVSLSHEVVLAALCFFLYLRDRVRYLLWWALAWALGVGTLSLQITQAGAGFSGPTNLAIASAAACSLVLMAGGCFLLLYRRVSPGWGAGLLLAIIVAAVFSMQPIPYLMVGVPLAIFMMIFAGWSGVRFIRMGRSFGGGAYLVGVSLILFAVELASYPLFVTMRSGLALCVAISVVIKLGMAAGMLILHFDWARVRLSHAHKMEAVGRLTAGIAHDFNNLLTAMIANNGILLAGKCRDCEHVEHLRQSNMAAQRAAELTRRLLAFGRKQDPAPRVHNLDDLVAEMLRLLNPVLGEQIETVQQRCSEPLFVCLDSTEAQQVVTNLLINARDAMPTGGRVVLSSARQEVGLHDLPDGVSARAGAYAVLQIADSGYGMSERVKARMFEPFFTTKMLRAGTGLGLASAYGIVAHNDGFFQIESAENVGTTVRVYLPLATQAPATLSPAIRRPRSGAGVTIMLAEDEEIVRQVTRHVLEAAGYTVVIARDGKEAVALAELNGTAIDLLITDVVMPGLGGLAVAKRWRERIDNLPVVFVSGYPEGFHDEDIAFDNHTAFLAKPFSPEKLLEQVESVIPARP